MKNFSDSIKYIGVDDTDIDLFEGQYVVPAGMAYNSFVIDDEKIAVTDTVDSRKVTEWLANLQAALAGRKPDYLVIHHLEPAHAGAAPPVHGAPCRRKETYGERRRHAFSGQAHITIYRRPHGPLARGAFQL